MRSPIAILLLGIVCAALFLSAEAVTSTTDSKKTSVKHSSKGAGPITRQKETFDTLAQELGIPRTPEPEEMSPEDLRRLDQLRGARNTRTPRPSTNIRPDGSDLRLVPGPGSFSYQKLRSILLPISGADLTITGKKKPRSIRRLAKFFGKASILEVCAEDQIRQRNLLSTLIHGLCHIHGPNRHSSLALEAMTTVRIHLIFIQAILESFPTYASIDHGPLAWLDSPLFVHPASGSLPAIEAVNLVWARNKEFIPMVLAAEEPHVFEPFSTTPMGDPRVAGLASKIENAMPVGGKNDMFPKYLAFFGRVDQGLSSKAGASTGIGHDIRAILEQYNLALSLGEKTRGAVSDKTLRDIRMRGYASMAARDYHRQYYSSERMDVACPNQDFLPNTVCQDIATTIKDLARVLDSESGPLVTIANSLTIRSGKANAITGLGFLFRHESFEHPAPFAVMRTAISVARTLEGVPDQVPAAEAKERSLWARTTAHTLQVGTQALSIRIKELGEMSKRVIAILHTYANRKATASKTRAQMMALIKTLSSEVWYTGFIDHASTLHIHARP